MLVHSLLVFFPNDGCTVFQGGGFNATIHQHTTHVHMRLCLGTMPKFVYYPHTTKTGIFWVKHQIWFTTHLWACESQWCLYPYMVVWLGTHIRPCMSPYGPQSLKHLMNEKNGRTLSWKKTTIICPPECHNSEFLCSFTLFYTW